MLNYELLDEGIKEVFVIKIKNENIMMIGEFNHHNGNGGKLYLPGLKNDYIAFGTKDDDSWYESCKKAVPEWLKYLKKNKK